MLTLDAGGDDAFAREAGAHVVVQQELRQHQLHGAAPLRVAVQYLVHDAHAARAEHAHDLVAAAGELCSGLE